MPAESQLRTFDMTRIRERTSYVRTLPVGMLSLGGGKPDPLPLEPVFVGRGRAPPGRLGSVGADMTSTSRLYLVIFDLVRYGDDI
jgi:hypothetical protein